jgi:multiple sugar transport system substrate-binding protein
VTETGSVDTAVIGLGTAISVPIIYYNAELVARIAGSEPIPQEWDRILALIDRLGKAAPGTIGGFCQHVGSSWIYLALVESLGGSMMSADDRRIAFNAAPGRRALEIFQAFGRAGQARADMGRDQARQAFAGGGIALLVDSSSSLAAIEAQVGGRYKLGTARIPIVPTGHIPVAGIASILLARDAARQAAAWRFMKFVSGPEGQTIVGKSTGYFPANDIVVRQDDLLGRYYEARPLVRPITGSLAFASRWYAFPGDNSAKIDAVLLDGITSVVTLSKTPGEALAEMERKVEQLLPAR